MKKKKVGGGAKTSLSASVNHSTTFHICKLYTLYFAHSTLYDVLLKNNTNIKFYEIVQKLILNGKNVKEEEKKKWFIF